MPTIDDIRWFKQNFHAEIEGATAGTSFTVDMLTALACQETGSIWPILRGKGLPVDKVLALCVGDTLDEDKGRRAFPRNRDALLAVPNGQAMFEIAREALIDMAKHIPGYQGAAARPHKFCHGFGIFQLDLQFFKTNPTYFLEKRYARFADGLARALGELKDKAAHIGLGNRTSLSDIEMAHVAIAYNTGGFVPSKGLKQGHQSGGKFYGENFFEFLKRAKTVPIASTAANPTPNRAVTSPPSPVTLGGIPMKVDTREGRLLLRKAPSTTAKIDARLPDGHPVVALTGKLIGEFLEIETSIDGGHFRGFSSSKFLVKRTDSAPVEIVEAAPPTAAPAIPEAHLVRQPGSVTRRTGIAGATSLNEAGQPKRSGANATELCASLGKCIDWLAVDNPAHKRYAPRDGLTFCNIYAHDYCAFAGVYLPRVWWTQGAIAKLATGQAVAPLLGASVSEMRANGMFHWLRDFGPMYGWRRTGPLTKLQLAANAGAVGLIVAIRKEEGRPGHIVMIAPESLGLSADRNAANEVILPIESQAGARNFRLGHNKRDWWTDVKFADAAFWIHD